MAEQIQYNKLGQVLEARIAKRLKRFQPGDKSIREALTRIGIMIEAEAKKNVRRRHLIDTGTLINSIRFRLFQQGHISGVSVGSYGVRYAAAHEFGFNGPVLVQSHARTITKAFGKPIQPKSIMVATHVRQMQVRARPYLKPALISVSGEIRNIIKGLV